VTTETGRRGERSGRRRYVVYATVLVINFLHLVSYTYVDSYAHTRAFGDALNYLEMSRHTFAAVDNPFALRMLTPWMVHTLQSLSGISLDYVWIAVTYTAISATLIVFFKLLYDQLGLSFFGSTVGTVLLAYTGIVTMYNFGNIWLVDPVNNLCMVLGIYFLVKRKLLAFTVVVVLGVLNKETMLFLAPLYPLLAWVRTRRLRDRTVLFGVVAMVVAAGAYLVFRTWALAHIGGEDYRAFSGQNGKSVFWNIRFALNNHKGDEFVRLFGTYTFLWLIFGYGLYLLYRQYRLRSELVVVSLWLFGTCLFGRLFATDTERVFVLMAPVVIAVCAVVFDKFHGERDRLWIAGLVFLYAGLNLGWIPPAWSLLGSLAAIVVFIAVLRPDRELTQSPPEQPRLNPNANGRHAETPAHPS
jgi:hypothetical protein